MIATFRWTCSFRSSDTTLALGMPHVSPRNSISSSVSPLRLIENSAAPVLRSLFLLLRFRSAEAKGLLGFNNSSDFVNLFPLKNKSRN